MASARAHGIALLIAVSLLGTRAIGAIAAPAQADPPPQQTAAVAASSQLATRGAFAGDEACRTCHQNKFDSYHKTAHHLTSRPPSAQSISGKFTPGSNTMETIDPSLHFQMEARPSGFYQTAVIGDPPHAKLHSARIDIVVGSGTKGQTYLSWRGNALFQLPVSYWVDLGQWVNSPGYLDGTANFDRPIPPRCLECHATYIKAVSDSPFENHYFADTLMVGISCERCHGPGRAHVEKYRALEGPGPASATPGANSGTAIDSDEAGNSTIVNPANLPRDRAMDVCGQCHGGLGEPVTPAFTYTPGEPLAEHIKLQVPDPSVKIDVHGNQVELLERSKCYQSSATMTCATCHDVHARERPAASYSTTCLTCHKAENCGMYPKLGSAIAANCIDCHMPVQQSNLIVSDSDAHVVRARVRNHWIKVYPQTVTP
ncbi:MAG: multiheme c-type cytochrome [Candidatus Acidiferrales bacterium]